MKPEPACKAPAAPCNCSCGSEQIAQTAAQAVKFPDNHRVAVLQCLEATEQDSRDLPFYAEKRIDSYMPLAYSFSMQTVVETPMFLRAAEAIYSEADREEIVRTIAATPEAGGDLMPGTGGYRKLRFARSGMGKRGGARVVYLYGGEDLPIFLITVYAKSEKGNLSKAEQNALTPIPRSGRRRVSLPKPGGSDEQIV